MNTIVRLDKVKSTAHLVNIVSVTALENGAVVALGDLLADGEGYKVAAPTNLATDRLVFHASVPMGYDEMQFEEDYSLAIGEMGRAYFLEAGDIVTISDDGFTSAPTLKDLVGAQVGSTKLAVSEAPEGKVQFVAIAKEFLSGRLSTVLEVL